VGKKTVPFEICFFAPLSNFQEREFIVKGGLPVLHVSAHSRLFSFYSENGCGRFLPDVAEFVSDRTWSHPGRR
jgi:hypothetical protein